MRSTIRRALLVRRRLGFFASTPQWDEFELGEITLLPDGEVEGASEQEAVAAVEEEIRASSSRILVLLDWLEQRDEEVLGLLFTCGLLCLGPCAVHQLFEQLPL